MLDNMIVPAGLYEDKHYITTGENSYIRTYHMVVWPSDVYMGWLQEVYSMGNVDVSFYLFPLDRRYVCDQLTEHITRARAHWTLQKKQGKESEIPELEAIIQDTELLRRSVQRGIEKLFKAAVIISVRGETLEDLDKRCEQVKSALSSISARITECFLTQAEAYKYNLPLMQYSNQPTIFTKTVTLGGAASSLPVISDNLSHPQGAFIGFTGTGNPVFLDPFIGSQYLPNPHISVFGTTGAGKSVTLKVLSARLSLLGVKCLLIDWEGEYFKTVIELMDGQMIKINPSGAAGINPFDIEAETEEGITVVNISEKVADIRGLIAAIVRKFANRPLSAVEINVIEEAVRETYASKGINKHPESLYHTPVKVNEGFVVGKVKKPMPTFSDFYSILASKQGGETLAQELKVFRRGESLGMFDCETTVTPGEGAVCFDISKIPDEFTRFYAMYVLLNWAWHNYALKQKGKKLVVLDEAWMFMKYPESAEFLEMLARRGRKKNVGLVVASQYIEEFLNNDQGKAVIASCATKFLLGQEATVADSVVNAFKLPPGLAEPLSRFRKGRGYLTINNVTSQVNVISTPYEYPFVNTDPNKQQE